MTDKIWRGMTRVELDAAYNNGAAVPHSTATRDRWAARSAKLRAADAGSLDLAYGPKPRNKIDLFRSGAPAAPLFVFIHAAIGSATRKKPSPAWPRARWRTASTSR
jgi:arylformamidase